MHIDNSFLDLQKKKFFDQCGIFFTAEETVFIQKALEYAEKYHKNFTRRSGEPYIVHALGAAGEVLILQPDVTTVIATLLHDAISVYGSGNIGEIERVFGADVATVIKNITTMSLIQYTGNTTDSLRVQKMILSLSTDIRTLFVKLAERTHNLKTLSSHVDPAEMGRLGDESLFLYAPIAARLGLYYFRDTIETLAGRTLDLDAYLRITGELAHYTLEQEAFLTESIQNIQNILGEKKCDVVYRVKKPYSIYRKMQSRDIKKVIEMYDIFAIRIIVESLSECYEVLGMIHGKYAPMPGRVKDFIAVPKLNGYQSLHTTVLGLGKNIAHPVEIQIRTRDMDDHAEKGIAAHFFYKQFGSDAAKNAYFRTILEGLSEGLTQSPQDLGKTGGLTVFVLTPRGDIKELPRGATPVDFAYAIHSGVGSRTIGARVNGRMTPLSTQLAHGDVVEVLTHPHAHPSPNWLDFVVSAKAKTEINVETKKRSGEREAIVRKGRDVVVAGFHEKGVPMDAACLELKKYTNTSLTPKKLEELLYQIGQGIRRVGSFFRYKKTPKTEGIVESKKEGQNIDIIVGGASDIPFQFAQCCHPVYPADIIAVMRTGGKCMIHEMTCSSLTTANPARQLEAHWSDVDPEEK